MNIEQLVLEKLHQLSPDSQKEVLDLVVDLCRRELPRTAHPGLGIKEILQDKREAILDISARHGAYNLRVFGSVARGEADEYSDIDFLVEYSSEKASPWFPTGLIRDLETLLGRKVDVVTEGGLKDRIRDRILQEAKPL